MSSINRHDFLLLFDVTNGNPNGDPDSGNMPRWEQNTNRGLVSDVCLKRKVRNYVLETMRAEDDKPINGYDIFIQPPPQFLNDVIAKYRIQAEQPAKETGAKGKELERMTDQQAVKYLCEAYFDIRTFGAVLSTGVLSGSPYGQVRGPVQITFAQSFHPIISQEIGITRCAVTDPTTNPNKEREMGNKYIVSYALYAAKGYISPGFAKRTGFTNEDLKLLFRALYCMFEYDRSAARGEMILRGLYDFEHIGTQPESNIEQNKREAQLGCIHAHKLFEGIKVKPKDPQKLIPESFDDYVVECLWDKSELKSKGVELHQRHEE